MKRAFFTNKYTVSVLIMLAILAADILLHKGMSRTILPKSFTDKRKPQFNTPICDQGLLSNGKRWIKAVNTPELMLQIDTATNGIEMDVYFDTVFNNFFVYHDSANQSITKAEDILEIIHHRRINASVWFDFKNLNDANKQKALLNLLQLKKTYNLQDRILVESSDANALNAFCDSGFFTSYYVPFFNPYQEDESKLIDRIDSISSVINKYPVSALSGYYFQTPFLKKFFPAFPLLTWTDDSKLSLVNKLFNKKLEADENVKIVLHSSDN